MLESNASEEPRTVRSRVHRWLLVVAGVTLVAVGAVGVFLPGLPTVVFLLGASWCFARSCPWLEDRLIRIPLFKPFVVYLDNGAQMPRRVVVWTLVVMWAAIAASSIVASLGDDPRPVFAAVLGALGLVGSFFIIRLGSTKRYPTRLSAFTEDKESPGGVEGLTKTNGRTNL
jgi:uncharacterized membrane protein YbaN (DUF454 family)